MPRLVPKVWLRERGEEQVATRSPRPASPEKVSGTWLFRGTRVPVRALVENLEDGARVDDFLEWFPGVTREQVEKVLAHASRSLIET